MLTLYDFMDSGNGYKVRLLLAQLLHNAWKFSAASAPARIAVTGEHAGGHCRIHIRDNGIGFDTRYAHKLFEPLQRLHAAEQGAGHGLGLAIAQRIANRHGGTITGVSQSGDGATFTVDLPGHEGSP